MGVDQEDEAQLLAIQRNAALAGAHKLEFLSKMDLMSEPMLCAAHVLNSPSSGIIDSHAFMAALAEEIHELGSDVVLNHEVINIEKMLSGGFKISVKSRAATGVTEETIASITADVVVNAAGLRSDRIARMILGENTPTCYELHFIKGLALFFPSNE